MVSGILASIKPYLFFIIAAIVGVAALFIYNSGYNKLKDEQQRQYIKRLLEEAELTARLQLKLNESETEIIYIEVDAAAAESTTLQSSEDSP